MTIPAAIGVVDLMIGFPDKELRRLHYEALAKAGALSGPAGSPNAYLFGTDLDESDDEGEDPVAVTIGQMDRYGVAVGMIATPYGDIAERALREHPDRFVASLEIDPNDIAGAVRAIRKAKDDRNIKAVNSFPAGCTPQVPVNDRRYYPIYQTCIDLDLPIILNAGIPGPRVRGACQDVLLFDEVCYDFPELRIVMRHGAEPWTDMAVKLMLKWPGLYYMTSAFAPKYYPQDIVEFANTRGSEKIMYAGYYPMGLSLERIFGELPNVPFRDDVWPKFLRTNAMRVFKLGEQ